MSELDARVRLRSTFDAAAERYDRLRPGYPAEIFDDIEGLAGLRRRSRVLEIGCGTGQATRDLAARGYEVTALELGPALATVARRNLAGFPRVEVVTADFEQRSIPDARFDAVVSATAFHWIDPELRVVKAATALRPAGALAIIDTDHVAGGSERFFADVQECYERWDPATEAGLHLPSPSEVVADVVELEASGWFGPAVVRRYETDVAYKTSDYLELLQTYSGHLALEGHARERLLDCIGTLIDRSYGGRIVKRYLTTLRLANRLA